MAMVDAHAARISVVKRLSTTANAVTIWRWCQLERAVTVTSAKWAVVITTVIISGYGRWLDAAQLKRDVALHAICSPLIGWRCRRLFFTFRLRWICMLSLSSRFHVNLAYNYRHIIYITLYYIDFIPPSCCNNTDKKKRRVVQRLTTTKYNTTKILKKLTRLPT